MKCTCNRIRNAIPLSSKSKPVPNIVGVVLSLSSSISTDASREAEAETELSTPSALLGDDCNGLQLPRLESYHPLSLRCSLQVHLRCTIGSERVNLPSCHHCMVAMSACSDSLNVEKDTKQLLNCRNRRKRRRKVYNKIKVYIYCQAHC